MRLKELRKQKGLSLKELGDILGVAESTVSLYENQKREASYNILLKAADFFDVSVDYILDNDTEAKGAKLHTIHLPILESVSIENDNLNFNYSPENETVELGNNEEFFYYKMHGDSMEPQFYEGDIVLIKKQNIIENNCVAAVIYGDNPVMLRKVTKNSKATFLQPFNPKYPNIFVEENEKMIILGKVEQIIRKC